MSRGTGVISVGMLAKIRRLHLREGLSIRTVSRRTGLSRNAVRQWLRQADATEPKYSTRQEANVLDPWAGQFEAALRADAECGGVTLRTVHEWGGANPASPNVDCQAFCQAGSGPVWFSLPAGMASGSTGKGTTGVAPGGTTSAGAGASTFPRGATTRWQITGKTPPPPPTPVTRTTKGGGR